MIDISANVETAAASAVSQYSDFMIKMQNFALHYLGGTVFQPDDSALPAEPSDNGQVDLQTGRMFDPGNILDTGWPVYDPPSEPEWETLWSEATPSVKNVWESTALDTLTEQLASLAGGGDLAWFTQTFQQKAFDTDKDRRLQALDDSLRMLASKHASRGNRLPSSALTAQESEIVQKYQFDNTSRSGELIKLLEESARDFMKFGMEKQLSSEQIQMEFTTAYNQALLEPIKLRYEAYIKQIEGEARAFESEIKGVIARFDAEKASWELTGTYNSIMIERDIYPWKKYEIQVNAAMAEYKQKVDLYKSQISAEVTSLSQSVDSIVKILGIASSTEINFRKGTLT